jgi:hypothetical protein
MLKYKVQSDSSVTVVTILRAGRLRNYRSFVLEVQGIFTYTKGSRSTVGALEALSQGDRRPMR